MDKLNVEKWKKAVNDASALNVKLLEELLNSATEDVTETSEYFYLRGLLDMHELGTIKPAAHNRTGLTVEARPFVSGDLLVEVAGRATRIKRKGVLVPIPIETHKKLMATGNLAQAAAGLIEYAIERLEKERRTLHITTY